VSAERVELADYRAAALRWLAREYPGLAITRWETVIILPPEQDSAEKTVERETAYVQTSDGGSVAVCFYINLRETQSGAATAGGVRLTGG